MGRWCSRTWGASSRKRARGRSRRGPHHACRSRAPWRLASARTPCSWGRLCTCEPEYILMHHSLGLFVCIIVCRCEETRLAVISLSEQETERQTDRQTDTSWLGGRVILTLTHGLAMHRWAAVSSKQTNRTTETETMTHKHTDAGGVTRGCGCRQ